jgi:hypothetical protein
MSHTTRRTFIVAAGGSAAAAAVAPAALASAAQAAPDATPQGTAPDTEGGQGDRLVAYIDNPRSGHITVMRGEDEVTVHDPELVQRLNRATRR